MESLLYQINRLIDDKDQLVAEKNDNLQSHHKMWRELASALAEKDRKIENLLCELWQRASESEEITKRHNDEMLKLREDCERRTDLLELKLQQLEAAHMQRLGEAESACEKKTKHLQRKLNALRQQKEAETQALTTKNQDLDQRLKVALSQIGTQDRAYYRDDESILEEFDDSDGPDAIDEYTDDELAMVLDEQSHNDDSLDDVSSGQSEADSNTD
ncbi:uncharacterized protein K489DRAFT_8828 [Dissoconium aciculare CBS 342.82]|uniref:Uncharacterized protein n=1 Tax=Dissoconium aciculare CBS 342.82 TaxID=1314786 RepID=A0A6J3MHM6_9PEZI|nr:uncharacterized protein K489DRAFT_8828 [Dissoconium aciculare CBS 342.82]KAF1827194.1 hypothetical protein K489DRAFT_8828 [Dissoconium aciculare CBS 342.82]